MELRPYQQEAIDAALAEFKRGENALVEAATGAGKTVIMASIAKQCEDKYGIRVLCLVHRKTLVDQNKRAFVRMGSSADVTTIQTAGRRDAKHYNLVIVDECHRLPERDTPTQYARLLAEMQQLNPRLRLLGVTATPYRLGCGYIYGDESKWFKRVCYSIGTKTLQAQGFLSPLKYKVAATIDTSNISTTGGDYNELQLESEMTQERHLLSVHHALKANPRKAVAVFCVTINHAVTMAKALGAMCLHSEQSRLERQATLQRFAKYGGVLCSVMALTEGWDATNCDCVVLARPTTSTALYVQMIGRGLRIHPDKEDCLVLDMVGAYNRFGSPYNPEVKTKVSKKDKEREDLRREEVCPECGFVTEETICPECGCNIKEMNEEVEYLNKPPKLTAVDLDAEFVVGHVDSQIYRSKVGQLCIRATYYNKKFRQLATDYFNMESPKATPRRKLRKCIKRLFGVDIGADFTTEEALNNMRLPLQPNIELEIETNGKYKNAIW